MDNRRIAIASDHAGFEQKQQLIAFLEKKGQQVIDCGPQDDARVDYPDYAVLVAGLVSRGEVSRGVLVCGTGIGMAIAADKVAGVRAASITSPQFATLAREHNDLNIITLSGRFIDLETNKAILDAFLDTPFAGGRHEKRVEKMMALDARDATLAAQDAPVAKGLADELLRQRDSIELIASENFTSVATLEAVGSVLTNKYAEGLPGKRYYGGCECVDVVEDLARERACELFGCHFANVQPHSGSQANEAIYTALVKPGDTVMGMSLAHGGHLTHGSPVNFSGRLYDMVPYGVDSETEMIDLDAVAALAYECKPKLIIAGASAYPRLIDFEGFARIAHEVGAYFVVDMAHIAGLVAGGAHPSPIPFADVVTSTSHKTLRGPRGGFILTNDEELFSRINKAVFPGTQGGPLMHVIAGKAVAFGEALKPEFKRYAQQVVANAARLGEGMTDGGLRLVSGGTDNHLCLVDLTSASITGKDAEALLGSVGITCNKNTIPNETLSPFVTSGVRIGSAAVTTRGFDEGDSYRTGSLIAQAVFNRDNERVLAQVAGEVASLLAAHPLYPQLG